MNTKNTNSSRFTIEDVTLKVRRELLNSKTKAGADMYCYVCKDVVSSKALVNGKLEERKREIRCDFVAKQNDFGGYDMLDLIFMFGDDANLSLRQESITDDNKNTTTFIVYEIWNTDDDGVVYSYKVKPMNESDKAVLNVIVQRAILAMEKQASEEAKHSDGSKKQ